MISWCLCTQGIQCNLIDGADASDAKIDGSGSFSADHEESTNGSDDGSDSQSNLTEFLHHSHESHNSLKTSSSSPSLGGKNVEKLDCHGSQNSFRNSSEDCMSSHDSLSEQAVHPQVMAVIAILCSLYD